MGSFVLISIGCYALLILLTSVGGGGDVGPRIISGFQEATIQPGSKIVLDCTASGSPIPKILWYLYDELVSVSGTHEVEDRKENSETIISNLTLNKVETEDGGIYICEASNTNGKVIHSARVNVHGKLGIRTMPQKTIVAGQKVFITCPYYGFPVAAIEWKKDSTQLPVMLHQKVFPNGTLSIDKSKKGLDDGIYSCVVANNHGQTETKSVNLAVMIPPKIMPFSFQEELLREGMRARLQCVVSEGDSPITIQWLKDNANIEPQLGVHVRQLDEFSSILTIGSVNPRHNGNYTCKATNSGATASHTAKLNVNAPPKVIPFSFLDDQFYKGMRAHVTCAVSQGDPPLTFQWIKDEQPLSGVTLGIAIRQFDKYTSSLSIESVSAVHSGNYTCVVTNQGASVSHTAQLLVHVPPKIVPFTFQDEHLLEGMLVRVSCVVSRGDLPLNITWQKDGETIPAKLSVTIRDFDDYSSVMSIDPVTSYHNGRYTCKAANAAGSDSFSASISVNELPKWVVKPNNTKVVIGSSTMLPCVSTGFPKPVTKWYKVEGSNPKGITNEIQLFDGYEIFANGSLYINNMQRNHAGYYYCSSENSIGSISTMVVVTITFSPQIENIPTSRNETIPRGNQVHFQCAAHGDQPLTFHWYSNGQVIKPETVNRFYIKQTDEDGKSVSELRIQNVERKDSTLFTCIVSNSYGSANATFHLSVLDKPDPPTNLTVIEVTNRSIVIGWVAPFNGNQPITKYIIQYKLTSEKWASGVKNLTLPGHKLQSAISILKPSVKYNVRVIAANEIGLGDPSIPIEISMAEQAPGGPPLEVTAIATDSHSLKISWKPPHKELWNGIIRGYNVGYKISGSSEEYKFRMLEVPEDYTSTVSLPITNLLQFTQYRIIVQAFNDGGKGPNSKEIIAITSESVPTKPPQEVRCSVLSSQTIHLTWSPPPAINIHGLLQGYKVMYMPVDARNNMKPTVNIIKATKLTLQQLDKFTNYSIQVLSMTRRGDGVKSEPIFCRTMEDIPEEPSDVKVLSASEKSVLVAWKPPLHPNGVIIKYTVYIRPAGVSQNDAEQRHSVRSNISYHEITELKEDQTYQFSVTASTVVGESASSRIVSQSTSNILKVPKVAGFDGSVVTSQGDDVILPCKYVGLPNPQQNWLSFVGSGNLIVADEKHQLLSDGSLLIRDTDDSDTNNYTCHVENAHGHDQITYAVTVQSTPGSPFVEISLVTVNSIEVQWKMGNTGGSSILGYKLNYKHGHTDWKTIELDGNVVSHHLDELQCGTNYQIYVVAHNKLGHGRSSPVIETSTKGGVPLPPTKTVLIEEGSTFISLNLESWLVDKCPIKYFLVEYKSQMKNEWNLFSDDAKPEKRKLVLSDLAPSTWYNLRMIAHSSAGTSAAEYSFATLSPDGATIAPETMFDDAQLVPVTFMFEVKHVVALMSSILIVILIAVIVWICAQSSESKKKHKSKSGRHIYNGSAKSESGSDATYNGSYGYSAGRSTMSNDLKNNSLKANNMGADTADCQWLFHTLRKCDLAPYATGHLTDHYIPEELIAFDPHHSVIKFGNTLPGMGRSKQSDEAVGLFPSTVDIVNFHGNLQQMPTPCGPNSAYYPRGSKGDVLTFATPVHQISASPPLPPPPKPDDQCHASGAKETTFTFPPPPGNESGSEQMKPVTDKYDAPWDVKGIQAAN